MEQTSKAPNLLDVSVVVGGEAQMVVSPVFLALVGHVLDQHDFSAAAVRAKPKEVDEPAMPELLMRCVVKVRFFFVYSAALMYLLK